MAQAVGSYLLLHLSRVARRALSTASRNSELGSGQSGSVLS
jgi:hypothetical protein